jgi:tryptophanyl-tRNA synthetase
MSKSIGNTILLCRGPGEIEKKVKQAYTDPKKLRKDDPGGPRRTRTTATRVRGVGVSPQVQRGEADSIADACRAGTLGCVADKKHWPRS